MNEPLKELRDLLFNQFDALSKKFDNTPDEAMSQAIITEMKEILHRVDLVQNLIMQKITDSLKLKAAIAEVKTASQKLSGKLKNISKIDGLVGIVTHFLVCVDNAIDIAKVL